MANMKGIIDRVLTLADSVNEYLPGAPMTQGVIDLARKVEDIVAYVGDDIPIDKQDEALAARLKLAETIKAKAAATSDRLRG